MGNVVLLGVVVLLYTIVWIISRWAVHRSAKNEIIGIIQATVIVIGVLVVLLFTKQKVYIPRALLLGTVAGAAEAIGFVIIMLHCLKIGSLGSTAIIYNLGLVWPVITGVIFFSEKSSFKIILGICMTIFALVLMIHNSNRKNSTKIKRKWIKWALLGWMFGGIAMTFSYITNLYESTHVYTYLLVPCKA